MTTPLLHTPDFQIVIRSAGERTEKECLRIVKEQSEGAEVVLVREHPFKKALEKCFRIGIDSHKKWLITIDADMILLPGTIKLMVREAEKMPGNYLQLQGKIADKITGTIRKAGPRIYRISLLPDLLILSESYEDHIRPESRIITISGEKGYPSRYLSTITCLHDYEQYYKDIYRKTYVHVVKHPELLPEMLKKAVEEKGNDVDYKVMLQAIWDGLTQTMNIAIDTRLFTDKSDNALKKLGLKEKSSFVSHSNWQMNLVDSKKNSLPQTMLKRSLVPYNDQPMTGQEINFFQKIYRGGFRGFLHRIGSLLVKTGKKLQID